MNLLYLLSLSYLLSSHHIVTMSSLHFSPCFSSVLLGLNLNDRVVASATRRGRLSLPFGLASGPFRLLLPIPTPLSPLFASLLPVFTASFSIIDQRAIASITRATGSSYNSNPRSPPPSPLLTSPRTSPLLQLQPQSPWLVCKTTFAD